MRFLSELSCALILMVSFDGMGRTDQPKGSFEQCAHQTMNRMGVKPNSEMINHIANQTRSESLSFRQTLFVLYGVESAWRTDAVSSAGAIGIGQLMPATALEVAEEMGLKINLSDLKSLELNVKLSSYLFKKLLTKFDENVILALIAYNAGPVWANRWLKTRKLPNETSSYLIKIFYYKEFCTK